MATTEKTSLAIGLEELSWARSRASHLGLSLSGVVTAALREARRRDAQLAAQRAAWATYLGDDVPTDDELRAARAELEAP